ncbi:MAG: trypsin-like peptidase domain-containing protein, partial [Pseudomonadota bacterium]
MWRILALLVSIALPIPAIAQAQDRVPSSLAEVQLGFAPVARASAPAVVNIYATRVVEQRVSPFAGDPFFSQFFGRSGRAVPRLENSLGSGVIVGADGVVVSNHHVVGDAQEIRVVLSDRREFDAEILLSDAEADLAVIRLIDAADLPVVELGNSDVIEVGDLVLAIGNPFGVGQTVTSGIVSGLARSGGGMENRAGYYIQTDAPINPGNSGGALVDMAGRLIGVNTSILTRSGGSNGIGFAIPSNLVAQYVAQARAGGRAFQKPWAGLQVQEVDHALAQALGQPAPRGVLINDIHAESPFAAAGLSRGDIVLAINGLRVDAEAELEFRLSTSGLGAVVEVAYLRNSTERTAQVHLDAAPGGVAGPVMV